MAEELRLAWDMDLGPLQMGHRIVGAWLKSASAATRAGALCKQQSVIIADKSGRRSHVDQPLHKILHTLCIRWVRAGVDG